MSEGRAEPWYRSKPPAQIAQSALIQIARKRDAGCPSCVEAYVALARKNGAIELEISAALGITETSTVEDGRKDDQGSS